MNDEAPNPFIILSNPIYCLESWDAAPWHETMVSKADWIKANSRLIDEVGKEAWLQMLLQHLETPRR